MSMAETSMLGWSFIASVTQLLTYFRRESHLIFLPFASALQATIARLRTALSAFDTAASAGTACIAMVPTNNAVTKNLAFVQRNITRSPFVTYRLITCS
ncbi:hypothetical protein AC628_18530 [Bradyrhizobium sp. NAS96.2]|nr:hypothetical protein AC628_18530 [Bradyrhizobium sp. NAS96.2]